MLVGRLANTWLLLPVLAMMEATACTRSSPPGARDAAPAPENAPPSARAEVPTLDAGAGEDATRATVKAWSGALDRHDLTALAGLYAPTVKLYGHELPRSAVLEAKRHALGPASTFHQSIVGDIAVERSGDTFVATFAKRSGTTKMQDVPARIVIVDGHVREESDAVTDQRMADTASKGTTCELAARNAVLALPEVKKILEDDRKALEGASDGRAMGGLGPIPEDDGGFSASLGVHSPERYEAQVWYTVDRSGKLSVSALASDLVVPAPARDAVTKACRIADGG